MRVRRLDEIGQVIRGRRKELGLTQLELATRVGVSRQWIVAIEGGKPRAQVSLLLETLRALGLELSILPPADSSELDSIIEAHRGARR